RHLFGGAEIVDLRFAVDVVPQQPRKPRALFHDLKPGARRCNRAFNLRAIAYDAGVLHQGLNLALLIACNFFRSEAIKSPTKVVALAQDGDPRQAGLEAIEHEFFIERPIVEFRHAPLFVVIGDVERILFRPWTAVQTVGMEEGLAHVGTFASPGQLNFAQAGFTARIVIPPACSCVPAASASSTRSRRTSANPWPFAVEPSVPTCLSPAMIGRPELGANSSYAIGTTRLRALARCSTRDTTSCPT